MPVLPAEHTQRYQTARDFLRKHPDWDLTGHSLGARIALDLARELKDQRTGRTRLYNVPSVPWERMPPRTEAWGDLLDPVSAGMLASHDRWTLRVPHSYE